MAQLNQPLPSEEEKKKKATRSEREKEREKKVAGEDQSTTVTGGTCLQGEGYKRWLGIFLDHPCYCETGHTFSMAFPCNLEFVAICSHSLSPASAQSKQN